MKALPEIFTVATEIPLHMMIKVIRSESTYQSTYITSDKFEREPYCNYFYLPPFQRKECWSKEQKKSYIESLFFNYCLMPLLVVESNGKEYDGWLIDGQQRMSAIRDFALDRLEIFEGITYSMLTTGDISYEDSTTRTPLNDFNGINIKINVLREYGITEELLKILYNKLNFGGTFHKENELA